MLKIWLTWLQPSLGLLGIGLVLSNALCSYAAPKPKGAITTTSHTPKQQSPATVSSSASTSILSGISATPDMAVRQLAVNAMTMSGANTTGLTVQAPIRSSNAIASFLLPSVRDTKTQAFGSPSNQSVKQPAAIAARKIPSNLAPVVPGLFIGNADIRLSSKFLPTSQPADGVAANRLVASTVPTAMMMSSAYVAEPFPVVLPGRMQTLKSEPVVSTTAKIQTAPTANNPLANIATGLQKLLGNEPISEPATISAPVAKAVAPKTNSLLALSQIVTPSPAAPSARGSNLQLATAQVYTNVAKFDIPGVMVSQSPITGTGTVTFPSSSILAVKSAERDLAVTAVKRNVNSVALMNDRTGANLASQYFQPQVQQSWSSVSQRNNLGGLIMGSQSPTIADPGIALLPANVLKSNFANGLTVFAPSGAN